MAPPPAPDLVRLADAVLWAATRLCTPRAARAEGAEEWSMESFWPPVELDAGDDDEEW
jgi:hypothetical protein